MRLHKEGRQIIKNSLVITLVLIIITYISAGFTIGAHIIALLLLGFFGFICCFFRVPNRVANIKDNEIISPADGTVVIVKEVFEGEYLKCDCIQVSVFMSVFNVHINWFPIGGEVEYYKYHPGKYLVAMHPKSSEKNERTTIVVNNNRHKILFRQIAGLIARRIVCYATPGQKFDQCSETGFIKFGSRVDLFLPLGSEILVKRGERVKGTQTVIAKLPS